MNETGDRADYCLRKNIGCDTPCDIQLLDTYRSAANAGATPEYRYGMKEPHKHDPAATTVALSAMSPDGFSRASLVEAAELRAEGRRRILCLYKRGLLNGDSKDTVTSAAKAVLDDLVLDYDPLGFSCRIFGRERKPAHRPVTKLDRNIEYIAEIERLRMFEGYLVETAVAKVAEGKRIKEATLLNLRKDFKRDYPQNWRSIRAHLAFQAYELATHRPDPAVAWREFMHEVERHNARGERRARRNLRRYWAPQWRAKMRRRAMYRAGVLSPAT